MHHFIVSDSLLSKKELVYKLQGLFTIIRKLPYMLALQASAATEQEIKKLPDWAQTIIERYRKPVVLNFNQNYSNVPLKDPFERTEAEKPTKSDLAAIKKAKIVLQRLTKGI